RQRRRQHLEPAGREPLPAAAPRPRVAGRPRASVVAGRLVPRREGGLMPPRRLGTLAVAALALTGFAPAPPVLPVVLPWPARWISVPDAPPAGYGVYHFRRHVRLEAVPAAFVVHVTADNRYELFANGTRVATGPARGDLFHWRYETVDLAPFLRPGD